MLNPGVCKRYACVYNVYACVPGRGETLQPAKPAFLEYFEQKEREANKGGGGDSDNRKLPPDGDLEVVSQQEVCLCVILSACVCVIVFNVRVCVCRCVHLAGMSLFPWYAVAIMCPGPDLVLI